MLKANDLHTEITNLEKTIEALSKDGKVYESALLKSNVLQLKLLLNIRQNQVADMTARGVSLIKSGRNSDEATKR